MEIIFLWVGLIFVWIGVMAIRSATKDFANAQRVDGKIIGYVADNSSGTRVYAPVVSFAHPTAGRRIVQSVVRSNQLSYSVGDDVKVLADPRDPTKARLDTNAFFYFALVMLIIGIGCCVLFFSIYDWGIVSIGISVVVSFFLVREVRKRRGELMKAHDEIRKSFGQEAVPESSFDRKLLLPQSELSALRQRQQGATLIMSVIMILLGIGGLIWTWYWVESRVAFVGRAARADGRVVDFQESRDSDSTTWRPVVEFRPTGADAPVRFTHSVGSSHPSWKRGEAVRVLYDPALPSDAMIDQGWWNLGAPLIPGIVGALLALLGVVSLWRRITTRRYAVAKTF